jgi:putative ABC transport system substrate-binding protein
MRRREFILALGGAAAWPLAARAQQREKMPIVGIFYPSTPAAGLHYAVFIERLGKLGWIDGRTVAIESRWTEGRVERVAEIAAE